MPLPIKKAYADNLLARVISQDDIKAHFGDYQTAISFYRAYPDKLVDLFIEASGPECNFKLYPFQRIMLRSFARSQKIFLTFSRGTSKSFIVVLWMFVCCILYPGYKFGQVANSKQQSAAILEAKVSEVLSLLPILNFEIKKITKIKDQLIVTFKNGSFFQNVAQKQTSRGLRFTGIIVEEICEMVDDQMLREVILPTLAIKRRCANGYYDPDDTMSQMEIYVTTAGYKDSPGYVKLIQFLLKEVVQPGSASVLGGSYRIPIIAGLQDMNWIRDQKMSGELNPTSFAREFLSKWSTGSENAFFRADVFDKYRSLQEPEFERMLNLGSGVGYVFGIDVGRMGDESEIAVWKFIPQTGTVSTKHLVAIYTLEDMHFEEQAVEIKVLYNKYKPVQVAIDANGIGAGLVDYLVKSQIDVRTNQFLPPWGVSNDDKNYYSQFRSADMIPNVLWLYKANAQFNTEMYSNYQTQMTTGKLRFLIDEHTAKLKMDASRAKRFKEMSEDEKIDWIIQFTQTSLLKDQLANLEEKHEGVNIILDRSNKNIKKDKVSATGYALYYIKTEIDDPALRRQTSSLEQLMQLSRSSKTRKNMPKTTIRTKGGYKSIANRCKH